MQRFNKLKDINLHLSSFLRTPIYNQNLLKIGNLSDFFVDYEEVYPSVLAIQYKRNMQFFFIHWNDIITINTKKIIIKNNIKLGRSRTFPKTTQKKVVTSILANQFTGETIEYPPIGKIILDKQIVDTNGKKVVRVNDIQFIRSGQFLKVTHAEVGFNSMLRRLSLSFLIPLITKITPKSRIQHLAKMINWKFVHAIPNKNINSKVQLSLSNQDLKNMHPADLADILEDLDKQGRTLIFKGLETKLAADTLSEIEDDVKTSLIKDESSQSVAKIISEMDTDDAADVLNDLSTSRQDEILSKIEDNETQEEIQELLEYDEKSAGGLMTTDVFSVHPTTLKKNIFEKLRKEFDDYPILNDIFVIDDDEKLLGTCSLKELILHPDSSKISEIMEIHDLKKLAPDLHWKEVAIYMSKYNLITVPITDKSNVLLGMISVDDILPWLIDD